MGRKAEEGRVSSASRVGDIDRHIGNRIRERRIMLGLSQQQMADMVGVTYQQAHKYERGINRLSAGRAHQIATTLGVPVSYLFEGLGDNAASEPTRRQRMCLELARNFAAIGDERRQEALCHLARVLAGSAD